MSEEEIIKRLKNIIELNKIFLNCTIKENSNIYKDIQGLLDLYNKEKEKNKELYKDNQKQWAERCKLAIELDNNTVSKDKIKEKIKNLEDYIQENSDEQGYWGSEHQEDIYAKIEILEELLGDK